MNFASQTVGGQEFVLSELLFLFSKPVKITFVIINHLSFLYREHASMLYLYLLLFQGQILNFWPDMADLSLLDNTRLHKL